MEYFDHSGVASLYYILYTLTLYTIAWGFAEGTIIYFFKIQKFFRAVAQSVIVNLVSLVLQLFIIFQYNGLRMYPQNRTTWLALLILVIVTECFLLKVLNKQQRWLKLFCTSAVMNIVSYFVVYTWVYTINN